MTCFETNLLNSIAKRKILFCVKHEAYFDWPKKVQAWQAVIRELELMGYETVSSIQNFELI